LYVDEDEDVQTYGRLFNREVLWLILRYVLVYKKYLFVALVFVLIITGTNLLVPFLLRTLIDRHISKQGQIVDFGRAEGPGEPDSAGSRDRLGVAGLPEKTSHTLAKRLRKSLLLDDGVYFLFQSELKYFSKTEKEILIERGLLSRESFLLLERPRLEGETGKKVETLTQAGKVRVYGGTFFLFDTGILGGFTTAQVALLRERDFSRILAYVLFIVGTLLLQFSASYLQIVYLMKLSQFAMKDLRKDLFDHLLSLEVSYFDRNPVGKLVNRVTNDIETLNELFSSVLVTLFQDVLMMAGIAVIMFLADFRLALIVSASYPFVVLFTVLFRVQARNAYRLIRTKITGLNIFMNETITGIRIIQIFTRENANRANFLARNNAVYKAQLKELYANAIFRPLISLLNWFAIAAVIYFGARGLVSDSVTFGLLVMFVAYVERFFAPVHDLSEKFDIMQSATAAGEKLLTVFNAEAVKEGEGGSIDGGREGGHRRARESDVQRDGAGTASRFEAAPRLRGEVRFEDVWFSYQPNEWVLRGVSFTIKPTQTLAIVGETGAGKTTVISLLSKFYRIQRGRILIDGVSIDEIPYKILRENIASVMQDVFLFSRTVRDNITLGKPYDREWFEKVCGVTHVNRFLSSLPELDLEMVMERGATFSAGERQLVSFARALYSNPSILVLDEATSNIDTETETLIRDAIGHLTKGRTSIIIAHRLSTIKNADTIIVLDKGAIVEEGRHEELLAKRGIYHKLYTLQFKALS
jgi:ABC-type multidrug transport system fused ATPase/permease subunit